jgi:hypothetical protein
MGKKANGKKSKDKKRLRLSALIWEKPEGEAYWTCLWGTTKWEMRVLLYLSPKWLEGQGSLGPSWTNLFYIELLDGVAFFVLAVSNKASCTGIYSCP